MRLTHVVTLAGAQGAYGGPLRVAVEQSKELQRRGHDVTIVAGWIDDEPAPTHLEGVPAALVPVRHVLPGFRFAGLSSAAIRAALAASIDESDVVHVHLARDLIPLHAARYAAKARVPYVVQTHGMVVADARPEARLVDAWATKGALDHAARRFVLTDDEAAALASVTSAGVDVLPNGVQVDVAETNPSMMNSRPEVLFLARLHPVKRVLAFAQAAQRLQDRGADARFTVVGPDGGDLSALQDFITTSGIDLTYEGALEPADVRARLRRADIYVLPSEREAFPMSLLEAMACGVASVVTTGCAIAPMLTDTGAARVVGDDLDSLTAGIGDLLAHPQARGELGRRGREVVSQHFGIEAVVDQLEAAYGALIPTQV